MTEFHGWGRYPRHDSALISPAAPDDVASLYNDADGRPRAGLIARGAGRAYGDAAIGDSATVVMRGLDRIRSFDRQTGRVTVEAGLLLADLIGVAMPAGWFPPVVPGTRFVTIGGMIAADVHGKNHHRAGGFGDHVETLTLALPDGQMVTCGPDHHPDLFRATIGGMGLTGMIVEASFTLMPIQTGWISQRTVVAPDLDRALSALRDAAGATYSVAWIDCLARGAALGRSLVYLGEHATPADLTAAGGDRWPPAVGGRFSVPLDAPSMMLNRLSVGAFNALYYKRGARAAGRSMLVPWDRYFFPLDGIGDWNRLYGARGFVQYQCVLPMVAAAGTLADILERVSRAGHASFLAVLKQLGPAHGDLSFPMEGVTLALDLPVSARMLALLNDLDRLVVAAGGRLYLAKDARQSPATFEAGYPKRDHLRRLRHQIGAPGRLSSKLSTRLGI
ncbi:FAD-binding oxidoreductase [Tistrella bauzanensis]|uniref:FAD-binding oxidoreductase n=1 Tax=Tistrella TaxID=171436 RepID=UPI0031F660F2